MLPSNPRLRGELWLVLPTLLFDALVEYGELEGNVLIVPSRICEELDWAKTAAAFIEAGYNVKRIRCVH